MIALLLLLQDPAPVPARPFEPPALLSLSREEALGRPRRALPERPTLDLSWKPARRTAGQEWLRLGLGLLANDGFERWERDPEASRKGLSQGPRPQPHTPVRP